MLFRGQGPGVVPGVVRGMARGAVVWAGSPGSAALPGGVLAWSETKSVTKLMAGWVCDRAGRGPGCALGVDGIRHVAPSLGGW